MSQLTYSRLPANPHMPVAQKTADVVVFRRFKVLKKSSAERAR